MNRLFTVAIATTLFLALTPMASLCEGTNPHVQNTSSDKRKSLIMEPGLLHNSAAARAVERAREDKINRLDHEGSQALMIGDYPASARAYRALVPLFTSDICYQEDLAYALVGMGRKADALRELHNAFYSQGRNLYTSGRDIKGYATYALLEDEAGNWKEAVLAYNLAGAYGQAHGTWAKTDNDGWPNIDIVFAADKPQPVLLDAAAHAVIGTQSWSTTKITSTNDGYNHGYDQEIADLQRAVTLEPKWSTGWFYLGVALKRAQRYQQAVDAFNRVISLAGTDKKLVAETNDEMRYAVWMVSRARHEGAQSAGISTTHAPAP